MKIWFRRTVQALLALTAAFLLVCVCGRPAQASNDEQFIKEVEAFADLYRISEDEVIAEGVSIGGLDLGGMTLREAVNAIIDRRNGMLNAEVTLMLNENGVTYTMGQFGLEFTNPSEEVVKAACLGKTGSLIERYKANADLANAGYEMPAFYSVDERVAERLVNKFAETAEIDPVEATITRTDGKFVVTHEQAGIAVDAADMLVQVLQTIENWNGEGSLTLSAKATAIEPKYTYEALSTISDCLGSFETICGDIHSDRGKNVKIGAAKMNGNVVLPGESYSVVDILAPFTVENGYYPGVQYVPDGYQTAIGGGVCSLSSTLYNALLYAELQIDKRWNHSMTVSYVPFGFDSTVNDDGSRDLVFTNNTGYPIYIEAYTIDTIHIDDWLYFNIYGTETRDMSNRELKFTNNVLEYDLPTRDEFTIKVDYTLAPGEEVWVQGNYPHVVVEAYKEVWVDGEMVSKELLHTDTYRRSPAIIHYNPTPPPETEVPEETTEGDVSGDTPGADDGSDSGENPGAGDGSGENPGTDDGSGSGENSGAED